MCIPRKVATVVTLRIFQCGVFFICVSFSLNFQALVRIFHVFCPLCVQSLFTGPWFFLTAPRPPNFAEIHARGRRGRLEFDHRDLIPLGATDFSTAKQKSPPWQSGLIGIKVCSVMGDCYGGQGQLHDGGSCQDGLWQQTADPADILQYTVTDADAAVQSSLAPMAS